MITHDQWDVAAAAYALAKQSDPMMPNADELMIETWAGTIFARVNYPPQHVEQAVENYFQTWDGVSHMTGTDVLRECRKITQDREARLSMEEREQLNYQRDLRLKERGFDVDLDWYKPGAQKLSRNVQELIAVMPWAQRAIE